MKYNTFLYIIVILLLLFLIRHSQNKKNLQISETNNPKYTKCNRFLVHDNLKHVFKNKNINRTNKNNWDVYLPCGYNYVENEIEDIIINNKNQKIFAIKGCDKIASKNYLWKILIDYYGIDEASNIMPMTYIISNPKHLELFKEKYKKNKIYLLKKNIQRKKGILLTKSYEKIMRNIKNTEFKVIQEYVDNLYLIRNRKVNLRYYILIICKNDVKKGFLYKYGKCIYSNKSHDISNVSEFQLANNQEIFLTSLNLDPDIYNTLPESLDELQSYIGDYYYNILNSNVNTLFKKVMTAIENNICTKSNIKYNLSFQLFGADIVFNEQFKPYLLEFNKGPSMKYITKNDELMKKQLTEDIFRKVKIVNDNKNDNFLPIN